MNKRTTGSIVIIGVILIAGYVLLKIIGSAISGAITVGSIILIVLGIAIAIFGINRVKRWMGF